MSWTILVGLILVLSLAVALTASRRGELVRMSHRVGEMARAREKGSRRARLQYPHVDLSRCLGCGTCVAACPEEGVLELIHGQAIVVHGARCVGHGLCAAECPTGAIAVTLGDLESRRDIPAIDEHFEVPEQPGLFLAGEVTGYALIRTAISHGTAVATEVARRASQNGKHRSKGELDLCVVGAGPAGLACSLEAKSRGLKFLTIDQESLGGTVASYPRRKLVMTQPVELPLHGKLKKATYVKEELMELWTQVATAEELPIRTGVRFQGTVQRSDGAFEVQTDRGTVVARNVCLALGRRGTPRKLDVPGEDLPKVAYSLLDAQSYQDRRILVVGGGDSAVEAALGLAEQPGNRVALSYRREAFSRIKARNEAHILEAAQSGKVEVLFRSQVASIQPDSVELVVDGHSGCETRMVPNDDVFVMAGGIPPFELLGSCGVSFDPNARPKPKPVAEQGPGLLRALAAALVLVLIATAWLAWNSDYYALPLEHRPDAALHEALKPSGPIGLGLGIAGALLILANLAYLPRRSPRVPFSLGSLQAWMTGHIATGILALLCALVHAAMAPENTVGGHALLGLAVLVVTGAIGRYFYSFVPRAANGRELALDEVRAELATMSADWDREHRAFGERMRVEIDGLVSGSRWKGSFVRRLVALIRSQGRLRRSVERLRREGLAEGLPADQLDALSGLARRAQRTALMAAHYEDLRALLASWRYLHRWVALLMLLLVVVHVFTALRYGEILK